MKRYLFILGLIIALTSTLFAQEVSFTAQAPGAVTVGQQFRLTYSVNQQGSRFTPGNFSDFNHLGGPSTGHSTQMNIVNGKMTQSMTISYTYTLSASKTGKFTISPATITVGGKQYQSNPVTIEVVKGNAQNQTTATTGISNSDLFVRIVPNKSSIYQNEPFLATVKLYTRVQLSELSNFEMPQFNSFWKEDIETPRNVVWKKENVNGVIYNSGVLTQSILIPQKSGKLTLDPVELELIALQEVKSQNNRRSQFRDPFFDDFFGRTRYQQVRKKIKSTPVSINVKPIPKNTDAVGKINLSSEISKTDVETNESINLKIKVSGKANLKMIEPFDIAFPADFEVFDPKVEQNIKATTAGINGSKTFDYLLIPRHAGTFTIPSVSLTYLDPQTGKTTTLTTESYTINVKKGKGTSDLAGINHTSSNKEDIKFLGKDIRYIKTGDLPLQQSSDMWFKSLSFYLCYLISSGGFIILFIFLRKKRKESEDTVGQKNKKAAQLAKKKLLAAEKHIATNESSNYYEELLKALWGYISDKLNMSQSELSKDKVTAALLSKKVSEDHTKLFIALVTKCEMARYAPTSDQLSLSDEHSAAIQVISNIENDIKS